MAQKKKAPSRTSESKSTSTKVTRITATDTTSNKKTTSTSSKKTTPKAEVSLKAKSPKKRGFFRALGEYFKGSWYELRQVRWPNRRTTWSLTFAVLVFTAFFVILITLLDWVFQLAFERILG